MTRALILLGMALGAGWAGAIVLVPLSLDLPFVPPAFAFPLAFLLPGAVMAAMMAAIAVRRFFDPGLTDGRAAAAGSRAEIDQRALTNTVEQMLLALLVWPFIGYALGGVSIIALGLGMAAARLLYWIGCHLWAPLRAFGFAASLLPTIFGAVWAGWVLVN